MKRQAFMFSAVALIVAAIAAGVVFQQIASQDRQQFSVRSPVLSANQFLLQLEVDLQRALYISGYRSMIGLEERISSSGAFIDDIDGEFVSIITNGTVNGTFYGVMDEATLDEFSSRIAQNAARRGVDISLKISNVTLSQSTPFFVDAQASLSVLAEAVGQDAFWNYTVNVSSSFPIYDLRDPLYTVNTLGRAPNPIVVSEVARPFVTASNDSSRLYSLANSSAYIPNENAPSFLMRFSGNTSASPQGISSLVNTPLLDDQDITVNPLSSIVDYRYFSDEPVGNNIVNAPSWVRIDDDNLGAYDSSGKTT